MTTNAYTPSTFQSIFFNENSTKSVRVPDYQRSFAWDEKQINLFIGDLKKYKDKPNDYYFGHYIVENTDTGWDLVDGQQRMTTFVLFLMICRMILSPSDHTAFSLIKRFSTVSYDNENLNIIGNHLDRLSELSSSIDLKRDISDETLISAFPIDGDKLTLSLKRAVWSLLRFHQEFEKGKLDKTGIDAYINVVMLSNCSHHPAKDKSVAVNVFEMHNTRGIRLTTIEIVKAKLMQFVYDNGGVSRENKVKTIQNDFGEIFRMEELLAAQTFRGELSLEHLLRLHLRVVDDGSKKEAQELNHPAANANADVDAIVKYLDNKLNIADPNTGVTYALKMASEFKKSVQIVSKVLPAWDNDENLVGDVLILEKDLSCQFFLLACRRFETEKDKANGRIDNETLVMWEQLLFTRDLHENYYKLRYTDNFQGLFGEFLKENSTVKDIISKYLADGFRFSNYTKNLQGIVRDCLNINKNQILINAFYWWKHKMIYAIYKYEKSIGAELRDVVKGRISVEHILPQNWYGIRDGKDLSGKILKSMGEDSWKQFHEGIDACINGIGNLLLITPSENTSKSNNHPKDKIYDPPYSGGSYKDHDCNRGQWEDPQKWKLIIEARGEKIYKYMLDNLVGTPYKKEEVLSSPDGQTE